MWAVWANGCFGYRLIILSISVLYVKFLLIGLMLANQNQGKKVSNLYLHTMNCFPKGEHVFNLWWYNLCSNEHGVLEDQISEALSSWNSRSHSWTSHTNVSMYFSPFQNLRFPITSWEASCCYSFLISSRYIYFTVSPSP